MEFEKAYQNLCAADKEALDEAIMDMGITNYPALTKAVAIAETYMCEVNFQKTFKDFQASRQALTKGQDWCDENGLEGPTAEVLEYDQGSFIIVQSPGAFHLIIECSEWRSNNLESLEKLLYDRWYC